MVYPRYYGQTHKREPTTRKRSGCALRPLYGQSARFRCNLISCEVDDGSGMPTRMTGNVRATRKWQNAGSG